MTVQLPDNITIPVTISRETKRQIREVYESHITTSEKTEVQLKYIKKNLKKVCQRLRKNGEPWLLEIVEVASCLLELLKMSNACNLNREDRRAIVGALYYLCQPHEVIADYIPGRGYADDALVFNSLLSRLRKKKIFS